MVGAAIGVAGCGSGAANGRKLVEGTGYTFSTPAAWQIVRSVRQVQAVEGQGSLALVAVSRFTLRRTFRSQHWDKVVGELDHVADQLARQQHGSVTDSRTESLAGQQARRYKVAYDLRGTKLVERIAFVLRGKTEYLLLCRYEQTEPSKACDLLLESFRLI